MILNGPLRRRELEYKSLHFELHSFAGLMTTACLGPGPSVYRSVLKAAFVLDEILPFVHRFT